MTMRRRIEVNLDELDQIIDRSTQAPLNQSEGQKLKTAIHAMRSACRGNGRQKKPVPFCRRLRRPTNRKPANRLRSVMGATAPLHLAAPPGSPAHTLRSIPATFA
jgi:hypothetical protein